MSWRSKSGPGAAHFILPNGETACADKKGPGGVRMGDLLRCKWVERRDSDHLCRGCRAAVGDPKAECHCPVCGVKPKPAPAPKKRVPTTIGSRVRSLEAEVRRMRELLYARFGELP